MNTQHLGFWGVYNLAQHEGDVWQQYFLCAIFWLRKEPFNFTKRISKLTKNLILFIDFHKQVMDTGEIYNPTNDSWSPTPTRFKEKIFQFNSILSPTRLKYHWFNSIQFSIIMSTRLCRGKRGLSLAVVGGVVFGVTILFILARFGHIWGS